MHANEDNVMIGVRGFVDVEVHLYDDYVYM